MATPVVVITGSTKGIGLAMAQAFLDRGCRVVVCGRDAEPVEQTVDSLATQPARQRFRGQALL